MIQSKQNGHSIVIDGNVVTYDGVKYELPKRIWNRNGRSIVQSNDKIYIDEYVFKDGKFRWSLIGLLNRLF